STSDACSSARRFVELCNLNQGLNSVDLLHQIGQVLDEYLLLMNVALKAERLLMQVLSSLIISKRCRQVSVFQHNRLSPGVFRIVVQLPMWLHHSARAKDSTHRPLTSRSPALPNKPAAASDA